MLDRKTLITLVLLIAPILVLVASAEIADVRLLTRIVTVLCINVVLVLGLQVFMGNGGILSFAHIGFMGIGAYTSAVLTIPAGMRSMALPDLYGVMKTIEVAPEVGMILGGLLAALVAAAVSYPLMRLSDAAAVITSFALLMVLHTVMVHWSAVTNGPRTLFGIPQVTGLYLAAGVAVVMIALTLFFKESRTGILLRATRDDEVAAKAAGANLPLLRWKGFVLSAFMAGIGGGLWAHFITSFSPNAFYLKETFVILGMLVIGGARTVSGAILGTLVVTAAFEGLRNFENMINVEQVLPIQVVGLTEIVLSCSMIGVLILRPDGLAGRIEIGSLRLFGKWTDDAGTHANSRELREE